MKARTIAVVSCTPPRYITVEFVRFAGWASWFAFLLFVA